MLNGSIGVDVDAESRLSAQSLRGGKRRSTAGRLRHAAPARDPACIGVWDQNRSGRSNAYIR